MCVCAREIVLNANELKVVQLIATPLKKLLFRARLGVCLSPSRAREFLITIVFYFAEVCNLDHLLIVVSTSFCQRGCNAKSLFPIVLYYHLPHAATKVIHTVSHLFSRRYALHRTCERQIARILSLLKVSSIVLRTVLYCSRTNLPPKAQEHNIGITCVRR